MSEWALRFAEPADAEQFAKWAGQNSQVDAVDLLSAMKKENPTVLWFVVEKAGVVQSFAPLYLQFHLPHLGFNPDAQGKDKLRALQMLIDGVSAFAVQFGIREITTLSKNEYPIAQWALKHDFELDPRQLLKLNLTRVMEAAEVK